MRLLALAILCTLWAGAGVSAPVIVRGGEHAAFTRLVFSISGTLPEWTLEQSPTGYALVFSDPETRIRPDLTFSRIPRTRLLDLRVASDGTRADLVLACNCRANAFALGRDMLVIDLTDAPPEDAAGEPPVSERSPSAQASVDTVRVGFGRLSNRPAPMLPVSLSDTYVGSTAANRPAARGPVLLPALGDPVSALARRDQIDEAGTRLLEQLSRAASQGLLELTGSPQEQSRARSSDLGGNGSMSVQAEPPVPLDEKSANLEVTSSVDRDLRAIDDVLRDSGTSGRCSEGDLASLPKWGPGRDVPAAIAQARLHLGGELDRIDTTAALDLAKLYLFLGFGAEARAALALLDPYPAEAALFNDIASVMDGRPVSKRSRLLELVSCESAAALWALLAHPQPGQVTGVATKSLLAAFNALPVHLRSHLGPALSDRLLAAGDQSAAETVLIFSRRGVASQPDPKAELAEAQISLAKRETVTAEAVLADLAAGETDATPAALVDLTELQLRTDRRIAPRLAEEIASFALEHRNAALGPDLRRAHVLARAMAGQFDAATAALDDVARRDGATALETLEPIVVEILTAAAPDVTFLEHVLSRPEDRDLSESSAIANAVADRLLALGFPRQAARFVHSGADGAPGRTRRLLRGRIALAEGRYAEVSGHVAGLRGEARDRLMADTRVAEGLPIAALAFYERLGDSDAAARAAFLAGDWADLPATAPEIYRAVAAIDSDNEATDVNEGPAEPTGAQDHVLARHKAALARSAAARSTLVELLDYHSISLALAEEE